MNGFGPENDWLLAKRIAAAARQTLDAVEAMEPGTIRQGTSSGFAYDLTGKVDAFPSLLLCFFEPPGRAFGASMDVDEDGDRRWKHIVFLPNYGNVHDNLMTARAVAMLQHEFAHVMSGVPTQSRHEHPTRSAYLNDPGEIEARFHEAIAQAARCQWRRIGRFIDWDCDEDGELLGESTEGFIASFAESFSLQQDFLVEIGEKRRAAMFARAEAFREFGLRELSAVPGPR